jgi:sigma-B regulation protein RsbU (phosphoserine phosphatase)
LPVNFPAPEEHGFELFARVNAAREVSGDLYDFFFLPDGRLAFLVGDVSGKGMPAALFMVAIRSLTRHPATADKSPAETLRQLNAALAAGNYSGMFVTLVYGMYDPASGHVVLASGAHPQPLLRNADGRVEVVPLHSSRPLGLEVGGMGLTDTELTLAPGAALVLYTDGFTEACAPDSQTLFGLPRLQEALGGPRTQMSLQACADHVETVVAQFTEATSLQDDQTLFLLRRGSSGQ